MTRILTVAIAVALLAPSVAGAVMTFTQLDADVFVVSHRVKIIGSRGKAMKMVYTKAASLCLAAGFTHYRIIEQESEAAQQDDAANASVRVKYYSEDGDDRLGCHPSADPQYVQEAAEKLRRKGYSPPPPPQPEMPSSPEGASAEDSESACPGGCTIEQIAAMARAGLSDDKIRAACTEDG